MTDSPSLIRSVKRSSRFLWITSQTLGLLLVYAGLRLKGEVDAPVRQEPTYIKININIKLSNLNKIVMLSQTHGYNQFVRFPKTVKSINMAGSLNELKTVTGSRPIYKRAMCHKRLSPA